MTPDFCQTVTMAHQIFDSHQICHSHTDSSDLWQSPGQSQSYWLIRSLTNCHNGSSDLWQTVSLTHQIFDVHDHNMQSIMFVLHGQLDLPLNACVSWRGRHRHRRDFCNKVTHAATQTSDWSPPQKRQVSNSNPSVIIWIHGWKGKNAHARKSWLAIVESYHFKYVCVCVCVYACVHVILCVCVCVCVCVWERDRQTDRQAGRQADRQTETKP